MSLDIADETRIRTIVREETEGMRQDIHHLGVIQEVMQDDIKTVLELLSTDLHIKPKLTSHESRLTAVESDISMLKITVVAHSRQLKDLPS